MQSNMSRQHIESMVREFRQKCYDITVGHTHGSPITLELELIEWFIEQLDAARQDEQAKHEHTLHELLHAQNRIEHQLQKLMIGNDVIEKSIGRLETDVHNLIAALPGNQTPSTPDTAVTALLGRIDGASTAIEAALAGAGTPTPTPAPTP